MDDGFLDVWGIISRYVEVSPSGRWQRVANPRPVRGTWVQIPPPPPVYFSSVERRLEKGLAVRFQEPRKGLSWSLSNSI